MLEALLLVEEIRLEEEGARHERYLSHVRPDTVDEKSNFGKEYTQFMMDVFGERIVL